jgi:hypothetical protein
MVDGTESSSVVLVVSKQQQKPSLIAFNRALFHVTTGKERAVKASIKTTTALKQTVRYQLVDET